MGKKTNSPSISSPNNISYHKREEYILKQKDIGHAILVFLIVKQALYR